MSNLQKLESAEAVVAAAPRMPFWAEVWAEFRPYAKCFVKDWLIGVSLYLLQGSFELLERMFPLQGWSGEVVANEHSVGMVLVLALIIGLFLKDVLKVHRENG